MNDRQHLDLGCGAKPRNPYNCSQLFGVDIYKAPGASNSDIRIANLSVEPIPFASDSFDSLSAFDFIEHIPRILPTADGKTRFPFIELMDEVWRVLKPGGIFYAVTPAYPSPEAFQDPTHVNIITAKTHLYFCEEKLYAENYGFKGKFKASRVEWVHIKYAQSASVDMKTRLSSLNRTLFKARPAHLLWELVALKPQA
ncbi:methyltransferase domain-containing protein [Pseudomethylobacillus aquaticus]|nr:methyltransferase domain-containing protein [Pseudomethylobacillus aquaticus]